MHALVFQDEFIVFLVGHTAEKGVVIGTRVSRVFVLQSRRGDRVVYVVDRTEGIAVPLLPGSVKAIPQLELNDDVPFQAQIKQAL